MKTELKTDEILNILINRYYDYQSSQGHSSNYNDVLSVLSDFVESFSNGGLKIAHENLE